MSQFDPPQLYLPRRRFLQVSGLSGWEHLTFAISRNT
jgi:hypothetical protein